MAADLAIQIGELQKQIFDFLSDKGMGCPENVLGQVFITWMFFFSQVIQLLTMNESLITSLNTYQRVLKGEVKFPKKPEPKAKSVKTPEKPKPTAVPATTNGISFSFHTLQLILFYR